MTTGKMNVLNRVFSRNTFRNMIDIGQDDAYTSVIRRHLNNYTDKTNGELISEIYCVLKKTYRNEYFYKNTLLNKLLLGIHSVNTTTALTEISIAKSKADFVLINGKAVVYEIKTELDNFDRLENQVNDYYKAFDHVAVVTCEQNLDELMRKDDLIGKPLGLYILQRNGKIKTIRKPEVYRCDLDKEVIFKILRKQEYEEILMDYYRKLPDVSQVKYYKECKKMFLQLDEEYVYSQFLKQLKMRSTVEIDAFKDVPYELKFLAYFMELNGKEYSKLDGFLNERFGGV